jgi:MoaA/NifB/PqqE/SkfB family radical SAM enzyme
MTPGDFPVHLDIEVTSLCNLRCPFCATTYSSSQVRNGFMSWETVKKALDEAGREGAYSCKFNMRGEPLLHKELARFVSYAKQQGLVDVFFNTNGMLLTETRSRELIDAGLDRLTLSFEGFEKELYEKNRVGASFETVLSNVERLIALRNALGKTTPKVRVQAVFIPELKPHLQEFIAFWKGRVDQVSYNDMLDNVPHNVKPAPSSWICPFPYQRIMVLWDGTLTTCYNDFFGTSAMGNIADTSIKTAWGTGMERIRRLHREGRAHEIKACGECPLRWNEMKKAGTP